MATQLPRLPILTSLPEFKKPVKCIHDGPDVAEFLISRAYRDIGIFLLQLNHSLIPREQESSPRSLTFPLTNKPSSTPSIQALQSLLDKLENLLDHAPPDPGPRRFGNASFRKWYELVQEHLSSWLNDGLLGETIKAGGEEEVSEYLLGAFGSSQRLDYGTGHELSFLAFLGCLWKLGYFGDGEQEGGGIEREIVLQVFERYLRVMRKIILTYNLEPAGSHGVWGLDDHFFMSYIFGSAQFARPIPSVSSPTPVEGSVRGAPQPKDVTNSLVVEDNRPTNMYFSAIGFINDVKKGPFWEHSPILYDVSGIRDGWGKINKGMIKMFNAEVLSKFPVVQHFRFGSLFSWEKDPEAAVPQQSVHMANQPVASAAATGTGGEQWARATRMPAPSGPGIPYTRAPPGPRTGSLGMPPPPARSTRGETTDAQITVTKAPWAK
ncbi:hypothetical protein N3K66_008776 [Trichothecium roseum]|uniref:Uncharacterized protein n=1 Tax=Trichothecium roseum TaxID=47278 RepID=A0ACC0USU6_9HYPO|nr:hypothetical protein N3K66_008776 [Trichothecium roseum]